MIQALLTVAILLVPSMTSSSADTLDDLRWKNRLLIVIHSDAASESARQQFDAWSADPQAASERELLLISVHSDGTGTINLAELSRAAAQSVLKRFRRLDEEFSVVLVGKDGTEKQRWQEPVNMSEVFLLIDAMPMRRREMKERSAQRKGG